MTDETQGQTEQEHTTARSSRHRLLRWVPVVSILSVAALCWSAVLAGGIAGVVAWYLLQLILPAVGLLSLFTVIVYAIRRHRFGKLMIATTVLSIFALWPGAWAFGIMPIAYPASATSTVPSVTVRLPADGPLKVAWGGDKLDVNYHAAHPEQRWAYDLVAEPYLSGSTKLEDYGCYSKPVVAPATGLVVIAKDGEPDMPPGRLSDNTDAPLGNHVVIKLSTETYLVIAHLKPDSVIVKAGQNVEEGQNIGQCGNSGNTSEPHIHIHHQRQDPAVFPSPIAEGLPLFFRDHDGSRMPEGGLDTRDGKPYPTGMVVQHDESRGTP